MKLINNQQIRLFDELKALLTKGTELLISSSYISINAFFELRNELKKVILLINKFYDDIENDFYLYGQIGDKLVAFEVGNEWEGFVTQRKFE